MTVLQNAYDARNKKLNKIEKIKQSKDVFDSWEKLEYYAINGFDSIPNEDLSYFLKCFGIYYREKTPKQFMLKLRIPAGHLNAIQAKTIGQCAKEYGNDYIDLTTRCQCELRYLDIKDIPTILKRLDEVGINSHQTGVDNIRGIMGDPFDTLAYDNILPSHHLILKMQEKFLFNKDWVSTLPRKFNTAITGCTVNRCNIFVHDCCFALANKNGVYGYNLYLGGKVGKIAKNADIFLKNDDEVLKAFEAITHIFKTYGFKDNRNKNRLWFLIESIGIDEISKSIRQISQIDFETSGITMTQIDYFESDFEKISLRDNTLAVHTAIPSGMISGTNLMESSRLSTVYGSGQIRFDMEQSLYILGVKNFDEIIKEEFFSQFPNNNSYFNHQLACAGTKHCPFGVIENKYDAINMANFLNDEVPLNNQRIRMYWSGCVKGCGIHSLADIGFEGAKVKVDAETVSAVNIYIGGKLISQGVEGYSIVKNAPLLLAQDYIKELMLQYKMLQKHNESFENFHDRVLSKYSKAYIGFFIQLKAYLSNNKIDINLNIDELVSCGKVEQYEVFNLGRKIYFKLTNHSAFKEYRGLSTKNDNEKIEPINKIVENIDENIDKLVLKILDVQDKRALVFSELMELISYSK